MVLYKTKSILQSFLFMLLRLGYLTGAFLSLLHFNENKIVVSIITALCIFLFIITTTDEIIVYETFLIFRRHRIIPNSYKDLTINFLDLESIQVIGDYDTGDELYNPSIKSDRSFNEIVFNLKGGIKKRFITPIYISKIKKVIEIYNQYSHHSA